ncbi:MAG: DHH family phosphoesterase [Treponema sp.]
MSLEHKGFTPPVRHKRSSLNIAQRNRVMHNIYALMEYHQSFLVVGHHLPDEDCYASLVSCALILRKFNKEVTVFLEVPPPEHLKFLTSICGYNGISLYYSEMPAIAPPSVVFILDTPKPDMIAANGCVWDFLADEAIIKVELDHHFSSDAAYSAPPDYSLVIHASSTCEILCLMCYKISRRPAVLQGYNIDELYSRNLVLTLLTGMLGDAKMGNYLANRRDQSIFKYFSTFLNRTLKLKTRYRLHTRRINSIDGLLTVLGTTSEENKNLYTSIMNQAVYEEKIGTIILDKKQSEELLSQVEPHHFVNMIKLATDAAAEYTHGIGISVYYDNPVPALCKVHCRIRASEAVRGINLHSILTHFDITDGGGHPGAIAFRLPYAEISATVLFIEKVTAFIKDAILP